MPEFHLGISRVKLPLWGTSCVTVNTTVMSVFCATTFEEMRSEFELANDRSTPSMMHKRLPG